MKKITLSLFFALALSIVANAQVVFQRDHESPSVVGDAGSTLNYNMSGGSSTVQVGTGGNNTTQVLKAVHASGTADLYTRFGNMGSAAGDTFNVTFDALASNGAFTASMRLANANDTAPFVTVNANAGTTTTSGTVDAVNFGKITGASTTDFTTVTMSFTVPAGNTNTNARIQVYNFGATNTLQIDNVTVTKVVLSVQDLEKFNFKFYPNPAKDFINISADKNIDKVEIYNVLGQKVENRVLNSNNNSVNVSNLAKGTYVLKAFMDGSEGSYKFIKE